MDAHNETILGMRVFLGAIGLGMDRKFFQNYFSIKSYRGLKKYLN